LHSWLAYRKKEIFPHKENQGLTLLPGSIFSSFYTWMIYAMIISGGVAGMVTTYSFLAYHGTGNKDICFF